MSTMLGSGNSSSGSITFSGASSARYLWPDATENGSDDSSRFDKPWKPEPSSESSRSNARRFEKPGIRGPGATSSQARGRARRPHDSPAKSTRAGTRPVRRGKGVVRFSARAWCCRSAPKAKRSAPQVNITSQYREIRRSSSSRRAKRAPVRSRAQRGAIGCSSRSERLSLASCHVDGPSHLLPVRRRARRSGADWVEVTARLAIRRSD